MIKKISEYFQSKGLTVEKNNVYGIYDGMEINGSVTAFAKFISVTAYLPENSVARVQEWLNGNKPIYRISEFSVETSGVGVTFCGNSYVKQIMDFCDVFLPFFKEQVITQCCPFCGEQLENPIKVGVGQREFHAHEKCFDEYKVASEEKKAQEKAVPLNLGKGTLGAIVGSLAGCAVWVALYFIGFLAVVSSLVASFCAALLWDKFGGKNCKTKIVVIWVVTVVMLSLTIFGTYLIDVNLALAQEGLTGDVLDWFIALIREDNEFRNLVIEDTVFSVVFIIAGNVSVTSMILSTQKRNNLGLRKL